MVWILLFLVPSPEQRLMTWDVLPRVSHGVLAHLQMSESRRIPPKMPSKPEWVKDEIVVGFRASSKQTLVSALQARGYRVHKSNDVLQFVVFKIPKGKTVDQAIQELRGLNLSGVRYITRNYIAYAHGFRQIWSANRKDVDVPADALLDIQYNLYLVKVPKAWPLTKGDSSVVVAVLDTGLSYRDAAVPSSEQHCILWECGVNGQYTRAIEGPKHVKIVGGSDVVHGDDFPDAERAHGTHVSTTIAQQAHEFYLAAQNGYIAGGAAGIAPEVTIMPIKVMDYNGSGSYADIATGIQLAADSGAHIINMSVGGSTDDPTVRSAVQYAYSQGVLLVASCGNESATNCGYPAAYPEVIAVSAMDYGYNLASYSNSGPEVELTAPGGDYLVDNQGNYAGDEDLNGDGWGDWIWNIAFMAKQGTFVSSMNYPESLYLAGYAGTSMASPHVAAIAALVKSVNPSLPAETIRAILQQTAVDIGAPGVDTEFGYGLVDAWAACSTAAARRSTPLPVLDSIIVDRPSTPWGVTWTRTSGQVDTFWVAYPPQQPGVLDWFSFYVRLKNYGGNGSVRARLIARSAGVRVNATYGEADYGTMAHGATADGYFRIHLDDTVSLNRVLWFALAFSYDGGTTWPDTLGDFFIPVGAPPLWLVYDDYTGLPMNIDGTLYALRSHAEWYETTVGRYIASGAKGGLNYLPWYTGLMGHPTYDQGIMDLTSLKTPEVVIWWMGADNRNGLSALAGDTSALAAFLNGGGDLFLTGQDYIRADYRGTTTFAAGSFPYDYLGIASITANVDSCTAVGDAFAVSGVDAGPPQTDDLSFTLYCGGPSSAADSGWPRVYSDQITAVSGFVSSLQNGGGSDLAIRTSVILAATTPSKRWVGLLPLESQTPGASSDSLIFRFLSWANTPLVAAYVTNALAVGENPGVAGRVQMTYAPRLMLRLSPAQKASYRILLYNVLGRKARTWVFRPPYEGDIQLSPRGLTAGIYLLQVLENGTSLGTWKVILR